MKILFCTTELLPFSRVGRLAEYAKNIALLLKESGQDITLITPYYKNLKTGKSKITPYLPHPTTTIGLGGTDYEIHYHETTLPETDVPVILVESPDCFNRDGIYTNPDNNKGFSDNHLRFALFQEAILHLIEIDILSPDLLHLNEYHTALIPAMLKARSHCHNFDSIKTVLALHNIAFQGDCDESFGFAMGLDPLLFSPESAYEKNGRLNFLKAGILYADKVVAVSPTYATETRSNNTLGYGLSEELISRGEDYVGILNGCDTTAWNPKTDKHLVATFSNARTGNRQKNKKELLAQNGLDSSNMDIPTIGMVTRLTDNKGFDLLTSVFDKLMTFDLTFVMLGTGNPAYHKLFESIQMRAPNKFGLNLTYSNKQARNILGGVDFLLMPSRYEPCGVHQMIAMRYGVVPIGRATGGFKDSVQNVSDDTKEGWGFTFEDYTGKELLRTVWRAISVYKQKRKFKSIVRRAMEQDFSWQKTASAYLALYQTLIPK